MFKLYAVQKRFDHSGRLRFYKINTGTWQDEVDEFCLSTNADMMNQIREREGVGGFSYRL